MKLCIAEKPSVAKEIAAILGASTRKDGYYEGGGYWVSWTFGHLCTLKEPHDYTALWKWWNLATLPMIPSKFSIKVMDNQGVQKQFQTIKSLVERCEEVINCGDAGQEGELIQQWVLLKAKNTKPVKRLWISSLTEEAIKEGFQNLRDGREFQNLYAAGSSRAIGDWLLGMNATRLYTLKFGQERQVLSIGRVQTPTLAMIVERQKQIDNFKTEKYWELKTLYREVTFSGSVGRLKTIEAAQAALLAVTDKEFQIKSYEQKEGKEQPPRLFDLTSLQVEANNKHALSADHTLKLVQQLYEKKLVTYPRVDTTYLSDDIYPKVPKILQGLKYFSKFTESLLSQPIRKSTKVFNDKKVTDHHAIIPTGLVPSGINPDEQKIYTLIVKRFISVFYEDCIISNTTVIGLVDEVEFKATGKQIIEPGWRAVYSEDTDNTEDRATTEKASQDGDQEHIMPIFTEGEKGPHQPEIQEKHTHPPKYFTEATLLRAMETAGKNVDDEELREVMKENGIGRPSTRANIIETLYKREYIIKRKKNIHATITGIALIDTIKSDLLKSPELTGQWEYKLRQIEKGEYEVEEFKKDLINMVVEITNNVKLAADKVIPLAEELNATPKIESTETNICPKCKKGQVIKGKSAYGCSKYTSGCDFLIPFSFLGKKLSSKQLTDLIIKGKTSKIKGFTMPGSGEKRDGKLTFTGDFNIELVS